MLGVLTWALSPMASQIPNVTPGSSLCPWYFGQLSWRSAQHLKCQGWKNHNFCNTYLNGAVKTPLAQRLDVN